MCNESIMANMNVKWTDHKMGILVWSTVNVVFACRWRQSTRDKTISTHVLLPFYHINLKPVWFPKNNSNSSVDNLLVFTSIRSVNTNEWGLFCFMMLKFKNELLQTEICFSSWWWVDSQFIFLDTRVCRIRYMTYTGEHLSVLQHRDSGARSSPIQCIMMLSSSA